MPAIQWSLLYSGPLKSLLSTMSNLHVFVSLQGTTTLGFLFLAFREIPLYLGDSALFMGVFIYQPHSQTCY